MLYQQPKLTEPSKMTTQRGERCTAWRSSYATSQFVRLLGKLNHPLYILATGSVSSMVAVVTNESRTPKSKTMRLFFAKANNKDSKFILPLGLRYQQAWSSNLQGIAGIWVAWEEKERMFDNWTQGIRTRRLMLIHMTTTLLISTCNSNVSFCGYVFMLVIWIFGRPWSFVFSLYIWLAFLFYWWVMLEYTPLLSRFPFIFYLIPSFIMHVGIFPLSSQSFGCKSLFLFWSQMWFKLYGV